MTLLFSDHGLANVGNFTIILPCENSVNKKTNRNWLVSL